MPGKASVAVLVTEDESGHSQLRVVCASSLSPGPAPCGHMAELGGVFEGIRDSWGMKRRELLRWKLKDVF